MERRKRSWPVKHLISKPTRENPKGTILMFYAHEWDAYQKSIEAGLSHEEAAHAALGRYHPDHFAPAPEPAGESAAEPAEAATPPSDPVPTTPPESTIYPPSSDPSLSPDYDRHHRRCTICAHPDRDAIEGDFIRWRSPRNIAKNYNIADHSSLYRHAHATGLFARRRREFARCLEDILEMVEHSTLEETADVIIRAGRLYARLDENGKWFEPTRTNIILTGTVPGQYDQNPEMEFSAELPSRPRNIPFKLATQLTENEKANKRLIATHPSSENGTNS